MTIVQIGQSWCGRLEWGIDREGFTVLTKAGPEITVTDEWLTALPTTDNGDGVFWTEKDNRGTFLHARTADGKHHVWAMNHWPQLALRFPHDRGIELRHGQWPD